MVRYYVILGTRFRRAENNPAAGATVTAEGVPRIDVDAARSRFVHDLRERFARGNGVVNVYNYVVSSFVFA